MTSEDQLKFWAAGKSIHLSLPEDEQCCPDFSCCNPSLLQPEATRREFMLADDQRRVEMLQDFLIAAFPGKYIYAAP